MGDVVREVRVARLSEGGEAGQARAYRGYLDTGASKTVISRKVARALGGSFIAGIEIPIGGYRTRAKLVTLQLGAEGCPLLPVVVSVSDELVALIGIPGVEVVVGQDYMQGGRACIGMREKGLEFVHCAPWAWPKAKPARRASRASAR